jgi:hypothetical protein
MSIYFGTKVDPTTIQEITINDKAIEHNKTFRLLGVVILNDTAWDAQVEQLEKVVKRFYFSTQLVHACVTDRDGCYFLFNFTFMIQYWNMHVLFGILVLLNLSLQNLNMFRKDS